MRNVTIAATFAPLIVSVCALTTLTGAIEQRPVFVTHTDMVRLEATVLDAHGPVADLRQPDFELSDSGMSQTFSLTEVVDAPLDVVLVMQPLASLGGAQVTLFDHAVTALWSALRPTDRLGVVVGSAPPTVVRALTNHNVSELLEPSGIGGTRRTALFDGIATGLTMFELSNRRKVLIALTDGIDADSVMDAAWLTRLAIKLDPQIALIGADGSLVDRFSIRLMPHSAGGAFSPEIENIEYKNRYPTDDLRKLSQSTGGQIVDLRAHEPLAFLPKFIASLRFGYLFTYPSARTPGWHPITLKTKRKNLKVLTRTGYFIE